MSKPAFQQSDIGIFGNAVESHILAHTFQNDSEYTQKRIALVNNPEQTNHPYFFYSSKQSLSAAAAVHVWKRVSVYTKRFSKSTLLSNGAWYLTYEQDLLDILDSHLDQTLVAKLPSSIKGQYFGGTVFVLDEKVTHQIEKIIDLIGMETTPRIMPGSGMKNFICLIETTQAVFDSSTLILNDTRALPIGWSLFLAPVTATRALCIVNPPNNSTVDKEQLKFMLQMYLLQVYSIHPPAFAIYWQEYTPFASGQKHEWQKKLNTIEPPTKGWMVNHNHFGLDRFELSCKQHLRALQQTEKNRSTFNIFHLFTKLGRTFYSRLYTFILYSEQVDLRNKLIYFFPLKWVATWL